MFFLLIITFFKSLWFSILLISHAIHLTNIDRMSLCSDGKNSQATLRFTRVLKYLAELDLQGNVLTKLPDSVSEMKHLTSINLANNKFSIFPDKLTEIATLERIDLQGNSLTGKKELLMYPLCEKGTYLHISVFLLNFSLQKYHWRSCLTCHR